VQAAAEASEFKRDITDDTLYSVKAYDLRATLLNKPKVLENDTVLLKKLEQDNRRASRT
jgi:hypothetical protein